MAQLYKSREGHEIPVKREKLLFLMNGGKNPYNKD
jgi:hypothetical protein